MGPFPPPSSGLKWHGRGTGARRRAIYTWYLLAKCAHWPLDKARSRTLSGLFFPGEKGLIYQNSLEHRSGGIFNCFSW